MKIEIWADVTCPWCGLGNHRLKAALARFEHRDQVEVIHRSFQLDPSTPTGSTVPVFEMLTAKTGMSPAQIAAMTRRVEDMARAEGLSPYNVGGNNVGNTALAHEFLAYATEQGLHSEAWELVFDAYFGRSRSVFTLDDLVALGEEIGLDAAATRRALTEHRHRAQVEQDGAQARRLGATGVPFTVIDDRYGVSGAQDADTMLGILRQAWDAAHPVALTPVGGSAACGPDGCAIPG
ncbi:protein disulfide-isomerase [Acrocarpospora phusangensis]|uniref:Protein disulfide-isomerase n=1 Tax=Acrocarpospora phusangensis TaxID=1070424 RepID=A0A919QDK5_9ACTN|nr:DsbA family oxidoreductase [Acrocarpospora phusangensis]GIH25734.1 protein disulfide-isomerase [Acrocarpospora phusangensis]